MIETGSLSAAARKLGLSQPTLGRHVEALEQELGLTLFERTLQGLKPTETALKLFEPVAGAERALSEAALMAEGSNAAPGGSVRITASTVISSYVLPPILGKLRREQPTIALELVPSDSTENLLLRESDIAVRMFRPTQLDLITRKLGGIPLTCCAHRDYLDRRGTPRALADLAAHDLVGFDRSELMLGIAARLGVELKREDFTIRTDNQTAMWELLKAGLGVGFAQRGLVERTAGMVALLPELALPPLEVWLTTHRELFTNRRIRVIYDKLAEHLSAYIAG